MKNLFSTRSAKTQKQSARFVFISVTGESFSDPEKDSSVPEKTEQILDMKVKETPGKGFPNLREGILDVLDEES